MNSDRVLLSSPIISEKESLEVRSTVPGKRHQKLNSRVQREEFLQALERLGTVSAAVKELGLNRSQIAMKVALFWPQCVTLQHL